MSNKLYRVRYKTDTVDIEIESTDKSYIDSKLEKLMRTAPQTTTKKHKPAGPGKRGKTSTEQVEETVVQQSEKKKLKLFGYTSKAVSELANISISGAYRILDGQRMPGREALAKIAKVVGKSMDELNEELKNRQRAASEKKAGQATGS